MTDVEFFFDPSCPWTWVTSRWLATVAPERKLAVTWRPWSLPMKNEGRELPAHLPEAVRAHITAGLAFSTPALRVLEAAGAREGNKARASLYTELGRRYHGPRADGGDGGPDDGGPDDGGPAGGGPAGGGPAGGGPGDPRALIEEALAAAALPPVLAQAADDESWDEPIRATMEEVRRDVGDDVGVPIVAIRDGDHLLAMSGPILAEVPPLERALALWDAVATVVSEPAVFELKRHRTASPKPPVLDADGRQA
jgi:hypothetical protein